MADAANHATMTLLNSTSRRLPRHHDTTETSQHGHTDGEDPHGLCALVPSVLCTPSSLVLRPATPSRPQRRRRHSVEPAALPGRATNAEPRPPPLSRQWGEPPPRCRDRRRGEPPPPSRARSRAAPTRHQAGAAEGPERGPPAFLNKSNQNSTYYLTTKCWETYNMHH